jgi:predicted Zn-dependent protease with MMP-like domain
MNLPKKKFEALVYEIAAQVVDSLPPHLRADAVNVTLQVADKPTRQQVAEGAEDVLGLYEGTPLVDRTPDDILLEPDRITLFRLALTEMCESEEELREEIRLTIKHELGHYFGFDEDELEARGY